MILIMSPLLPAKSQLILMQTIQTLTDLKKMMVMADTELKFDGIKVTLEWLSQENPALYSYHVKVHPSVPTIVYGNSSAMLELCYNILYNVSILAEYHCEDNLIIFNEQFNYCEFTLIK